MLRRRGRRVHEPARVLFELRVQRGPLLRRRGRRVRERERVLRGRRVQRGRVRARRRLRGARPAVLQREHLHRGQRVCGRQLRGVRRGRHRVLPRRCVRHGPRVHVEHLPPSGGVRGHRAGVLQRERVRARRRVPVGHVPRVGDVWGHRAGVLRGRRVHGHRALPGRTLRGAHVDVRCVGPVVLHQQHLFERPRMQQRNVPRVHRARRPLPARLGLLRNRLRLPARGGGTPLLPPSERRLRDLARLLRLHALRGRTLRVSGRGRSVCRQHRVLHGHDVYGRNVSPRGHLRERGIARVHHDERVLHGPALHAGGRRRTSLLHARGIAVRGPRGDGRCGRSRRRDGRAPRRGRCERARVESVLRNDDLRAFGERAGELLRVPRQHRELRVELRLLPRPRVHLGPLRAVDHDLLRTRRHARLHRHAPVLPGAHVRTADRQPALLHRRGKRVPRGHRLLRRDALRGRSLRMPQPRPELRAGWRLLHGTLCERPLRRVSDDQ